MKEFDQLVEIMNKLRDPKEGCPWDLKQTHQSLKPHLLEEAYEVLDAIDSEDTNELKKELGDLLLQIVFHSQLAKEANSFKIEDVISEISEKLIRRHPHIFGDKENLTAEEVKANWEKLKKLKEGKKRILDGIPNNFNALLRSNRIQQKAAAVGFEWPDIEGFLDKIEEELLELRVGIKNKDQENIEEEIGDILFVLVRLADKFKINPEEALQKCNNKFINRFTYIEEKLEAGGLDFEEATEQELDLLWNEAKNYYRKKKA